MKTNRFPVDDDRRLRRMRWLAGLILGLLGLPTLAAVLRALAV